MSPPDLTPDCDRCAALCCIALAFDEGEDFAIDKPAGLPCPHLSRHACTIYERLDAKGFSGCARYDCLGAGQRTVAAHGGISWQDTVESLAPMLETFRHLRWIHAQLDLLETAAVLPLEGDEEAQRQALVAALCPTEMTPEAATRIATGQVRTRMATFLQSLASHV